MDDKTAKCKDCNNSKFFVQYSQGNTVRPNRIICSECGVNW